MFKKFASIALAALMITGTAAVSASAAENEEAVAAAEDSSAVAAADESAVGADAESDTGADSKIYFEAPSFWQNYKDIRIYLYNADTGEVSIKWNSKKGLMKDEGNGKWSFDLAAKGYTVSGATYACIFLTNTETQTCDIFIGDDCIGDTAYCTGENNLIENTVDSNKKSYEVKWRKADPNKYGVPLAITSIGNIVGSALRPGQTKYDLFAAFLDKNAGAQGIDNAKQYKKGKNDQQIIDETATALGLGIEDVKKAIKEKGRSDLKWAESKA